MRPQSHRRTIAGLIICIMALLATTISPAIAAASTQDSGTTLSTSVDATTAELKAASLKKAYDLAALVSVLTSLPDGHAEQWALAQGWDNRSALELEQVMVLMDGHTSEDLFGMILEGFAELDSLLSGDIGVDDELMEVLGEPGLDSASSIEGILATAGLNGFASTDQPESLHSLILDHYKETTNSFNPFQAAQNEIGGESGLQSFLEGAHGSQNIGDLSTTEATGVATMLWSSFSTADGVTLFQSESGLREQLAERDDSRASSGGKVAAGAANAITNHVAGEAADSANTTTQKVAVQSGAAVVEATRSAAAAGASKSGSAGAAAKTSLAATAINFGIDQAASAAADATDSRVAKNLIHAAGSFVKAAVSAASGDPVGAVVNSAAGGVYIGNAAVSGLPKLGTGGGDLAAKVLHGIYEDPTAQAPIKYEDPTKTQRQKMEHDRLRAQLWLVEAIRNHINPAPVERDADSTSSRSNSGCSIMSGSGGGTTSTPCTSISSDTARHALDPSGGLIGPCNGQNASCLENRAQIALSGNVQQLDPSGGLIGPCNGPNASCG